MNVKLMCSANRIEFNVVMQSEKTSINLQGMVKQGLS